MPPIRNLGVGRWAKLFIGANRRFAERVRGSRSTQRPRAWDLWDETESNRISAARQERTITGARQSSVGRTNRALEPSIEEDEPSVHRGERFRHPALDEPGVDRLHPGARNTRRRKPPVGRSRFPTAPGLGPDRLKPTPHPEAGPSTTGIVEEGGRFPATGPRQSGLQPTSVKGRRWALRTGPKSRAP